MSREYYRKNRDKHLKDNKEYYRNNIEYFRKYYNDNINKLREYNKNRYYDKSKLLNFSIEHKDIILYFN